jgi:HPt (histidine-containing phosphotransfer) domain-containing protein
MANGMDDDLSKPFKENDLLNKIGVTLNLPFTILADMNTPDYDSSNVPEHLYSTDYLKTLGNNKPEFIEAMLKAYVNSIPGEFDKLKAAMDTKDLTQIKLVVHKLKSSAKTLQIDSIEEAIFFVEKYAETELTDCFYTSVAKIQYVMKQVLTKVKKELD